MFQCNGRGGEIIGPFCIHKQMHDYFNDLNVEDVFLFFVFFSIASVITYP